MLRVPADLGVASAEDVAAPSKAEAAMYMGALCNGHLENMGVA
jgi:hypothetical protein